MSELEMREFANVWDAIADTPEEAANLTLRSELMDEIEAIIKKNGVDSGGGGEAVRGHSTEDQRSAAGADFTVFYRCAGEYCGGAGA